MGRKNGFSVKDEHVTDPQERTEFFIGDQREEDEPDLPPGYVIPPDGGWGWVIVITSFLCNLVVDGIIFSFGMMMNHLVEAFNESTSRVALVGSLLSGFYLLVGPFVSAFANKFGFRTVAVVGSIIGCIGFAASSFATSIEFLCITYGVIGGIGFGLVYVPAVIAVGFYFEKKRALATGIAVCGSGIGTFVMAPFTTYLIEEYGWRGTLLIQAGLVLNCAVFGALFRPLEPTRGPEPETPGTPLLQRIKRARDEKMKQCDSVASFQSGQYMQGGRVRTDSRCSASDMTVLNGGHRQMSALSVNQFEAIPENGELPMHTITSVPSIQISPSAVPLEADEDEQAIEERDSSFLRNESRVSVAPSMVSRKSSRGSRTNLDGSRPLYRDDIFYSASLLRLPQYTTQDSSKYHASVTRLPTPIPESAGENGSEPCGCCSCLPVESRHVLAKMTHIDLLMSPSFITISVSSFLTLMGFFVPYMYLKNKALLSNPDMSSEDAALLISVIGVANTIGRIFCGAVADHPKVNSLIVNNVALTIGGAVTLLCPMFTSYSLLMVYAVLFGVSIAAFASLRSILLVDLLGLEKLTNAFGLLLLFSGIAATAGGPIAGKFYDATADYDASFYFSGSLLLLSGVICYPLGAINRWEKQKEEKLKQAQNAHT